jgi:hypothetical protein
LEVSGVQDRALAHVRLRAERGRESARARIEQVLAHAGQPATLAQSLAERLQATSRVTLNFHPDRPLSDGRTVAERLLVEGRYRSQFETRISNGSRTAFRGGDRDRWEEVLFGGAYQEARARAEDRPKYGGLNLLRYADGACPRFGSCYFTLRRHMTASCTLTWGDSHEAPEHFGTMEVFEPWLARLLESAHANGVVLGRSGMDVTSLLAFLSESPDNAGLASGAVGRALDTYVEAQVHASIDLSADVEAMVVDPAFVGTPTGEHLCAISARYGIGLRYHPGFVLATNRVPADFRGPRMVPLAARMNERFARVSGELDAFVVGRAAESLHRDPETWRDWGTLDETLQHIKQMWHVLVAYGRPARA